VGVVLVSHLYAEATMYSLEADSDHPYLVLLSQGWEGVLLPLGLGGSKSTGEATSKAEKVLSIS